jgi:hypothetical protein
MPNKYRVIYFEFKYPTWPTEIVFEAKDPSVPLPSPVLLRVHACIAKMLNVSGLAKRLDLLIDPPEQYYIRPNGSTDLGLILAQRLLQLDY